MRELTCSITKEILQELSETPCRICLGQRVLRFAPLIDRNYPRIDGFLSHKLHGNYLIIALVILYV